VPGVSQATRERIRRVAEELSYVVSPEASALSRGQTGRVAIVVPRLDAWFYSVMIASMAPPLRAAELDMLVFQVEGEEQRSHFMRELPARRKADAVILTALPMAQDEVDRLDLMGVHVVVAGGAVRDFPHVWIDDLEAGRLAVQHLVDLGHRRIAMIRTSDTDGTTWPADVLRVRAWRQTLTRAGIEPAEELLVTEDYDAGAGARAMARLLASADPPTAVFAYSDELAFAAIAYARSAGVRVPEDLSVVGVDGHPFGELLGVTSVDQLVATQGRMSAELAVRLVSGEGSVADVEVTTRLVERDSTGPAPA
jgi:LacI family repressor for deo operon, udp, cdd, tsx, nupC, and nupG